MGCGAASTHMPVIFFDLTNALIKYLPLVGDTQRFIYFSICLNDLVYMLFAVTRR